MYEWWGICEIHTVLVNFKQINIVGTQSERKGTIYESKENMRIGSWLGHGGEWYEC